MRSPSAPTTSGVEPSLRAALPRPLSSRPTAGVDPRIAAAATRNHGLVDRHQLRALGVTLDMRNTRLARGLLHPVPGCPGVFAVGHTALGDDASIAAAVLACGPGSAATGDHAEWLWDLWPPWRSTPTGRVLMVVPRACGRRPPAARLIRRDLPPGETSRRRGIPVVSVERLIVDAGEGRAFWVVERLLDRALVERRTSIPRLEAQLVAAAGQRGVGALRRLLEADHRYAGLTRSELEEAFLALLGRAGVPLPEVNARLGRDVADALFARARLVVELDGTRWHRTRRRQEDDRRKELRLRGRGMLVLRYTARQVLEEPEAVVADLVRTLAERAR